MKWAAVLALAALAPCANALDFKGITVGKRHSAEEIEAKIGGKCGDGFEGLTVCNGSVTIAEVPATMNLVIGRSGIVQRIFLTFSEDSYADVRAALATKFGKPASARAEGVQNSFGAQYKNELLQWNGPAGTRLQTSRYAGRRDTSSAYFSTAEDRRLMTDSRSTERAKDL